MRAFIAFELPEDVRAALAEVSQSLRSRLAGAPLSWVAPRNMHLTLKFLGEIAPAQVHVLGAALQEIAARYAAMPIALSGLGVFPNLRRPRVVWAGLQVPTALAQLAVEVEDAMHALGFEREARAFTPHLTLARVRREARPAQLAALPPALAGQAVLPVTGALEQLVLFERQLKPSGAVYNSLVRIQLHSEG
ncbi:MAG: RNA 2',3'-cyclic phosphodiesterase [Anaerolineales bacterium]|nr:RNA 2',3'-cyclic phosphodiesterase [Anaerolineales bacterium]